ncbi:MAG: hypothetical protein ACTS6J_07490 [Burkholderiales bacterium]
MSDTVFTEVAFWLLVVFSFVLPFGIYWALLSKRSIAKRTILLFGLAIVGIAGVDVYLLQRLASLAKLSSSLIDDALFVSEISLALYFLPALFGGIGINLVSHVLISHLVQAESRFKNEHPDA